MFRQNSPAFLYEPVLASRVLKLIIGRLVSIARVGLPKPAAIWLGYLIPELLLPVTIVVAQSGIR